VELVQTASTLLSQNDQLDSIVLDVRDELKRGEITSTSDHTHKKSHVQCCRLHSDER
jgi:hypothetical protein